MPYDFDQIIDRRHSDSSKWRKYGPDVLPLWGADMDFVSPEPVIRALRARIEHGVFGYGMELPEFNETVVDLLYKRYDWRVSPEALVILPGVIAGFNLAGRAVTVPGDSILMQTPAYPPILRAPTNMGLRRDEAALTRLAEICLRHNLVICADEIHCDLVFQGHPHLPIASLAPEVAARTITLMAPSKTYNLAGLKCAFAIIPNTTLREKFLAARVDLVHSTANLLGYVAALAAYQDGQPWLDELRRYLEGNRDCMRQYVDTYLPPITMGTPEGTYLAWLDCRQAGIPHDDPYTFFLESAKVALNNGMDFGQGGHGFVRLNFGCPRALLVQALDRMQQALATL